MNRKQLTSILLAVVVLGGLGLWLRYQNTSAYRPTAGRMGEKVLGEFDVNAVARVTIRKGSNQVDLVKTDGQWTVQQRGGYPANFGDLSGVLRTLWELKVTQPVEVGDSQLGRLELLPSEAEDQDKAGTLIDLKDAEGKDVQQVLLGKQHRKEPSGPSPYGGDEGWPDGRYVMAGNGSEPGAVSLVTEAFSNVQTKPEQWLDKDFFKVEKIRSINVTYPGAEATNSFAVTRDSDTADLELVDPQPGEALDSSKVSGLKSVLGYPSFNDIVLDPQPEVTGLDDPKVGQIETFDDFTYTIKVGNTDADDGAYYVQVAVEATIPEAREAPEDESEEDKERLDKEFQEKIDKLKEKLAKEQALGKWTYLASKWSFDSLFKKRSELMAETVPLPPTPEVDSAPESPATDQTAEETPAEEPTVEAAVPETVEDAKAPAPPEVPVPAEPEPEPETPSIPTEEDSAPETPAPPAAEEDPAPEAPAESPEEESVPAPEDPPEDEEK